MLKADFLRYMAKKIDELNNGPKSLNRSFTLNLITLKNNHPFDLFKVDFNVLALNVMQGNLFQRQFGISA